MRIEIMISWFRNSVGARNLWTDSRQGRQDETVPENLSKKAKETWKKRKYGIFSGIAFRILDRDQSIQQLEPAGRALLGFYLSQELIFHDRSYIDGWPQSHPVHQAYDEIAGYINSQVLSWGSRAQDTDLKDWLVQIARHSREKICPE